LKEDDNGRTDLGTLEKRLAETQQAQRASQAPTSGPTSPSQSSPGLDGSNTVTPRSTLASPEPPNRNGHKRNSHTPAKADEEKEDDKQEGVEELSDMMCSLVTNNCGETRYIGNGISCLYGEEIY
jgi:hypothetical protein